MNHTQLKVPASLSALRDHSRIHATGFDNIVAEFCRINEKPDLDHSWPNHSVRVGS
jgi:hypothetical protein